MLVTVSIIIQILTTKKYRTEVSNYLSKYKTVVDLLSSIDINEYLP